MDKKEKVGAEIAQRVETGDVLGCGTGSTVDAALRAIAQRVKQEKLLVSVVPSSRESAKVAESLGMRVLHPGYSRRITWGFDGADAVDAKLRAIKGRGGAMLGEKILARKCERFVIIIDDSKFFPDLGTSCPVPVEFVPDAWPTVQWDLLQIGATKMEIRRGEKIHGPVITENGGNILDVTFPVIEDALEEKLKAITGVIESGLFLTQADEVLIADEQQVVSHLKLEL